MLEGHNEKCYYCNESCNSLAANPGLWPIALCHNDEPGIVKYHHEKCIYERLVELEKLKKELCEFCECRMYHYEDCSCCNDE